MILCDVGNTTFHFLINAQSKAFYLDEPLPKLDEKVYFISVNDEARKKLVKFYKSSQDLAQFLDFKGAYKGLGIDRAVASYFVKDGIVVDCGSAITIDIMKDFVHQGGFILPGISSYKQIYPKISTKLNVDFEKEINLDKIPLNTKDGINYAIINSIVLCIKNISKNQKLIFTGGDGEFLSKYFKNATYEKNLIFKSMKGLIDANNCTSKR